jgi:uncharacterized GH25 family protein
MIPVVILVRDAWRQPDAEMLVGGVGENQEPRARQASGTATRVVDAAAPGPLDRATRSLTGSLEDVDGRAVAGAHVAVTIPGEPRRLEATSDPMGRFRFAIPYVPRVRFEVRAAGFVPVTIAELATAGSHHCVLERAVVFRGRVFAAETGAPIAEARVRVVSRDLVSRDLLSGTVERTVRTAANGAFVVEVPAGILRVWIHAAGHVRLEQDARYAGRDRGLARFVLAKSSFLHGTVTDERGVPVAGAVVSSMADFRAPPAPRTTSDREGRFRVEDDGTFELLDVRAPGYRPWRWSSTESGGHPLRAVLCPAHGHRGVVVGPDGHAVGDAHVFLSGRGFRESTRTDARGRFSLPALPDVGTAHVVAAHPDFSPAEAKLVVGATGTLKLRLSPAAALQGQVLEDGNPVPGCTVVLRASSPLPQSAVVGQHRGTTDRDGRFLLAEIPAGSCRLRVSLPHGRPLPEEFLTLRAGHTTELTVDAAATCRIVGRVVTSTGRAIHGARLHWSAGGEIGATALSDRGGAFELDVAEGDGEFVAEHPGYVPVRRPVVASRDAATDAATDELRVSMFAARWIEGRVRSGSGELEDFVVRRRSTRPGETHVEVPFRRTSGWYRIGPLAPAEFELQAAAPNCVPSPWRRVDVTRGDARTELRLLPGVVLGGTVVDAKGMVVRLPMQLTRPDGTIAAATSCDARGRFEFEPVPPARYGIRVGSVLSPVSERAPREFRTTERQMRIVLGSLGVVAVQLEEADGSSCHGVHVTLRSAASGADRRAFTDAKGIVRFVALPAGTYRLSVRSGKGRAAPVSLEVLAGGMTRKTVRLR